MSAELTPGTYSNGAGRALTSTRARIRIGSTVVGWVNDFSVSESFGNVPIRVFGDAAVQMFETVSYNVNGSFGYMHILAKPLADQGAGEGEPWFKLPWTDRGVDNKKLINFGGTTLELVDWTTNTTILSVTGFKPEGRVFRLSEGAITMVNATFVALTLSEAAG